MSYNALGCYIFAGGFTVGMKKHFNIIGHLEEGMFGVETAKHNLKIKVWTEKDKWPLKQLKGKVDVIYCNPPCAPWSAAGRTTINGADNWKTDERVSCVKNAFEALELIRPKIWVWESVCRAYTLGNKFVKQLEKRALKMGYSVTYFFTCASLHGLPQYRKRFHMIVHNVELDLVKPACKIISVKKALTNVKDNTNDQKKITKHYKKIIKATPQGRGLKYGWQQLGFKKKKDKHGRIIGRPNFLKLRAHNDLPVSTMTGGNNIIHPIKDRFLTVKEAQVLTGFPENFVFKTKQPYQEIGKTVTPPIGDYLGGVFKKGLKRNKKTKEKIEVIDYRKFCQRRHIRREMGLYGK